MTPSPRWMVTPSAPRMLAPAQNWWSSAQHPPAPANASCLAPERQSAFSPDPSYPPVPTLSRSRKRWNETETEIVLREDVAEGRFIRVAGLDFSAGDVLLRAPRRLTPGDVALAAAMNHAAFEAARRPRVVILPTGDELVPPGTEPGFGQVVASTGHGIAAVLNADGANPVLLDAAPDDPHEILARLAESRADLLVTLGGASVGDRDFIGQALAGREIELSFHGVAMRPGKPLLAGRLGTTPLVGLPGNPVSAMVCAHVFLRPAIDSLLGLPAGPRPRRNGILGSRLSAGTAREHYMRARTTLRGTEVVVHPVAQQDSSVLREFAAANVLAVPPAGSTTRGTGRQNRNSWSFDPCSHESQPALPRLPQECCTSEAHGRHCSTGSIPATAPVDSSCASKTRTAPVPRRRPGEPILDGVAWLGLDWDGEAISQSARADRHREIAARLLASGGAYRCFATPDEIAEARSAAQAARRPFRFRSPWRDQQTGLPDAPFSVRLRAPREGDTSIEDAVQGRVAWQNSELDDLVLLRSDGSPTYMLAVVVDDHDMEVSHVIRGADHLTNAARQSQIFDALEWERPVFAHVPLIHGPDGAKYSKRHGAVGLEEFAAGGYLPEAMRNYLVRLGWSHGDQEFFHDWRNDPSLLPREPEPFGSAIRLCKAAESQCRPSSCDGKRCAD